MVKNLPASARDEELIPGSGRSPGEGNGNPLQYSCLGNPMDRGAWLSIVHGVAEATKQQYQQSIVYTCQSQSPSSSDTPFPLGIHAVVLYICVKEIQRLDTAQESGRRR